MGARSGIVGTLWCKKKLVKCGEEVNIIRFNISEKNKAIARLISVVGIILFVIIGVRGLTHLIFTGPTSDPMNVRHMNFTSEYKYSYDQFSKTSPYNQFRRGNLEKIIEHNQLEIQSEEVNILKYYMDGYSNTKVPVKGFSKERDSVHRITFMSSIVSTLVRKNHQKSDKVYAALSFSS